MLLFGVIGLVIPAVFTLTINPELLTTKYEGLSIVVAVIMITIYILSLVFSFYTRKDLYFIEPDEGSKPKWLEGVQMIAVYIIIVASFSLFKGMNGTIRAVWGTKKNIAFLSAQTKIHGGIQCSN